MENLTMSVRTSVLINGMARLGKVITPNQTDFRKKHGNDGNLFIVLPDNATLNLGATAPGRDYSLGVSPAKYKLFISGKRPYSPAGSCRSVGNFCVGQQIGFAPVWSPSAPRMWRVLSTCGIYQPNCQSFHPSLRLVLG